MPVPAVSDSLILLHGHRGRPKADKKRFYVNSWGRDKKRIIVSRVGVKAPARFLRVAEENSISEITKVTHPEADPF